MTIGTIFVGRDSRETVSADVCHYSLLRTMARPRRYDVAYLDLAPLINSGMYRRPMKQNANGQMYDVISNAPMATQFALSRFFVPHIAPENIDWALFCDGDFMFRANVGELFKLADDRYAVMCVKHKSYKRASDIKMRGYLQTDYDKKLWSSLMLFNLRHSANALLTIEKLNTMPGLWLHQFKWLGDDELIGALPLEWNWLYGVSDPNIIPKAIHFTNGTPDMMPYIQEWYQQVHAP